MTDGVSNALSADKRIQPATLRTVFEVLLPLIRRDYSLPRWDASPGAACAEGAIKTRDIDWLNLSTFIVNCSLWGTDHHAYELLKRLLREFNPVRSAELHTALLPFLLLIAAGWVENDFPVPPAYQKLFQDALHQYLMRWVEIEPEAQQTQRQPVQCSRNLLSPCSSCTSFNASSSIRGKCKTPISS
jgi:hypothetical protein